MRQLLILSIAALSLILSFCCTGNDTTPPPSGEALAKQYCSSCHVFPQAGLLSKNTWAQRVLPAMAKHLGISYLNGEPFIAGSPGAGGSAISITSWKQVTDYYQQNAPAILPPISRAPVQQYTTRFTISEALVDKGFPSATYVKIDPGNHVIYAANATDSSIYLYSASLHKISSQNIHGVLVDMNFDSSLQAPGARTGSYTNIGYINPNDARTGNTYTFSTTTQGIFTRNNKIADSLPRPVQTTACDLNKDGLTDYLVCGFGNRNGEFYWLQNKGNNSFEKKMLWAIPGAIKAYIDDYNHDGRPDIMVLFAQAQEGIYLFTNNGNGTFAKKPLLQFPPVYGSCYFELADMDGDGNKDILYACGDNADYSAGDLKPYHGLYIFTNDGQYNFKQQYFFPMYGCYKAVARDFNKDGKPDIAVISFFPDKEGRPQESFLYLEGTATLQFTPYAIPAYGKGNWLTMDTADANGDGYDDIVIGNLDMPNIRSNSKQQQLNKTAFLLLTNKGAH